MLGPRSCSDLHREMGDDSDEIMPEQRQVRIPPLDQSIVLSCIMHGKVVSEVLPQQQLNLASDFLDCQLRQESSVEYVNFMV